MTETDFRNVSDVPEDLEGGRIVGVGETFTLGEEDLKSSYNKTKIEEGKFLEITEPTQKPEPVDREALLARAAELDIKGRTTMRTDQLQTAIIAAEQEGDER